MKKAKLMLMVFATLAIIGGALAFMTVKGPTHTFYGCGTTTTMIGGPIVTGCFWPTQLQYIKTI